MSPGRPRLSPSLAPRAVSRGSLLLAAMLMLLLQAGCDRGEVDLVAPEGSTTATYTLDLRNEMAEVEGLSAETFGWTEGVPGAEATLLRVRDFKPIVRRTGHTDPTGAVRFEDLDGGMEWVTGFRRLEGAEAEALPEEWPVAALAGGGKVDVARTTDATLLLRPPRPSTLVISEVATQQPPPFDYVGNPHGGKYLEVYNNGTSTVWLDGMLLGIVYRFFHDNSRFGHHACADTEAMRVDPEGLWTARIWRFPGSGSEHPIEPGQAVVIAVSATDHREVHPTMLDLTEADFEFLPSGVPFADNPAAPNMVDVGPEPFVHYLFIGTSKSWFVAAPTDLDVLPRVRDPGSPDRAWEHVRIPRERILDVTVVWWDNEGGYTESGGSPICRDPVNPEYDAVPGSFTRSGESALSAQRRAIRARDGRVVVLDTDVSAIDFAVLPKTPGSVPEVDW